VVDDVSVLVRPGEILAVVGPSGAGKSSFLRLLNRLDEPTGGSVFLDRRDYRRDERWRDHDLAREQSRHVRRPEERARLGLSALWTVGADG
jgi:ABC-type methionine transport system ATPase subunit